MPPKNRAAFAQFPLLWIAVSFSAGIVCAKYCEAGTMAFAAIFASFAALAMLTMPRTVAAAALVIAFAALGGMCYQFEIGGVAENRVRRIYDSHSVSSGEPVEIVGVLRGPPEPSHDGVFLLVAVSEMTYRSRVMDASGDVRIFTPIDGAEAAEDLRNLSLDNNSRLRIDCTLVREESFQNPGVLSRVESLDEQGIDALATLKSPLLIENIGDGPTFSLTSAIYGQRQRLIEEFRTRFDSKTAGVLIASLLGGKYFLDKQTADLFREGGTFHILVISGLHITFLGGVALLVVGLFTRDRVWQFAAATIFLWSYTIVVGAEIPVVRASTIFTILLFSRVIHRQGSLLNSLGGCAIVLLAYRPSSLFTPSFQLTFVSVGAIVGIAFPLIANLRKVGSWVPSSGEPLPPMVSKRLKRFCETLYWRDAMWRLESRRQIYSGNLFKHPYFEFAGGEALQKTAAYLFEGLIVSLIVQICLLPLLVFYFHRVSIAGVVLNLWVGIVLAIETFAALAAVMIGQVSDTLALPLVKLAETANYLLSMFPKAAVDVSLASVRLPVYPGTGSVIYILYFIPVIAAGVIVFRWDPFVSRARAKLQLAVAAAAVFAIGSVIVLHPFSSPIPAGKLRIDFLDVGQGDSALVTFPNGETMLVDGGGRSEFRKSNAGTEDNSFEPDVPRIGEAVVSEFLWQKGYSRVDYLVATHADSDHIQGLADVAENFTIGKVIVGRAAVGAVDYDALASISARKKIRFETVSAGEGFEVGGARVEILNPAAGNEGSDNDGSVVMRIVLGERAFLLTGDIERAAEAAIAGQPLNADVVKVPHHGSRTSSSENFILSTGASFAIVPVARRSRFGHPHPEVIERWENAGVRVMTTYENGTITFETNGREMFVGTYVGNQ